MKLDILNRIFKSQAKVMIEEKTFKDGELYIKREVKHGVEAEKEIEKHSTSMSKWIDDFFTNFWKS